MCAGNILVDFVANAILLSKKISSLLSLIVNVNTICLQEIWESEGRYATTVQIRNDKHMPEIL